ncbi:S8 family peptidase [Paludifilum halophilum]|uniref:Peptidase S8/S53 domain-containing protein n=1 Tax=Paludifilum halophilum TaxID=1642702 RepID=A0A235B9J4_9BACL|nr:S8 family peptidase [Paludifilum halophilum]OYD08931.1 hypothetical protein CHM34_03895 [Paludifilum halophilum]
MSKEGRSFYTFLSRRDSILKRIRNAGGFIYYISRYSGLVSAMVPTSKLRGILQDPDLLWAEKDRRIALPGRGMIGLNIRKKGIGDIGRSKRKILWNIERIWGGVPSFRAGKGIRVGILDTGIDLKHPDLQGNIRGGVNFIDMENSPQDDNGHGTHVAGIVAATGAGGGGVVGVAPAADLYAVKVLNKNGAGTVTTLVQGIDWCLDCGLDIINLSMGSGSTIPSALVRAVNAARRKGALVIAAAGNNGNAEGRGDTVDAPARIPSVTAVAALDRENRRASFSAAGPSLDIAAPGVDILSTYSSGKYAFLSGTSQGAPHVSGAAAVYKQRFSGVSPDALQRLLKSRAMPLKQRRQTGAGLVRIRSSRPK